MKLRYMCFCFLLLILVGCTHQKASSDNLTDVSEPDVQGYYTCKYKGIERKFILNIPEGVTEGAPLLFMLHGYSGNAKQFADSTQMNETAKEYGYAVVYPQGIPDPDDKTSGSGWNSGLKKTGNDDTGFLVALAHYLQREYGFSAEATFAAGFSNGAFMMHRLASEAPDTFRAVASVAGFMTETVWKTRKDTVSVGFLQLYGTKDDVVPMQSNPYRTNSSTPVIEDVMNYWKEANGLEQYEEKKLSDKATAYCYSSASNDNLVWQIVIDGGRHSWPEEAFSGIDTNEVLMEFFGHYVK